MPISCSQYIRMHQGVIVCIISHASYHHLNVSTNSISWACYRLRAPADDHGQSAAETILSNYKLTISPLHHRACFKDVFSMLLYVVTTLKEARSACALLQAAPIWKPASWMSTRVETFPASTLLCRLIRTSSKPRTTSKKLGMPKNSWPMKFSLMQRVIQCETRKSACLVGDHTSPLHFSNLQLCGLPSICKTGFNSGEACSFEATSFHHNCIKCTSLRRRSSHPFRITKPRWTQPLNIRQP